MEEEEEGQNVEGSTSPEEGNQGPDNPETETYTREQVEELLAATEQKAREKGRNEAAANFRKSRSQERQPRGRKPAAAAGNEELASMRAELDELRMDRQFDESVPEGIQLSKEQRLFLRDAFRSQRPEDPEAWFQRAAKVIAPPQPQGGTQEQQRTATQRRRLGEQVTGDARPSATAPAEVPKQWNPLTATAEELARFREKHGNDPIKVAVEMRKQMQRVSHSRNRMGD